MNRRTLVGGLALAALSHVASSAQATEAIQVDPAEAQVVWTRYAAKRVGRRPSVIFLHGTHGFELKLSAYERYANALTAEGIDAYFVRFYTALDNETLKAISLKEDREAYDMQRYVAWTERVSSAITTILQATIVLIGLVYSASH